MENSRTPKPGEIYRHFKNKLYQVITIASHSESGEQLVIYQALYGDFRAYARPLDMFMSEVDRSKYPDVEQKYRFELVDRAKLVEIETVKELARKVSREDGDAININMKESKEDNFEYIRGNSFEDMAEEVQGEADPNLMRFLDAETYEDKLEVLKSLKKHMDERMISDIAVSLDIVAEEGTLEERYEAVKRCLETYKKFECNRFR